ncbi:MAG: hypothetical protein ABSF33_14085 [Acidimicrobiales bacterium]
MAETNVYIDGFNLYRGCIEKKALKWLDLRELSRQLLRGHRIQTVIYFTARVKALLIAHLAGGVAEIELARLAVQMLFADGMVRSIK